MLTFTLALICARAAAVAVFDGYSDNTWEHSHIEYGVEDHFRDVEVEYEEIEYSIDYTIKPEVRSR